MSWDPLWLWWWTYDVCQSWHATTFWVTCQQSSIANTHSWKHVLFSGDLWRCGGCARMWGALSCSLWTLWKSHKITLYSHAVFGESRGHARAQRRELGDCMKAHSILTQSPEPPKITQEWDVHFLEAADKLHRKAFSKATLRKTVYDSEQPWVGHRSL